MIYSWLDFLGYTTSKKYSLVFLWTCVGCICVFLYSLFDGKGERYFRLAAQVTLVLVIACYMLLSPRFILSYHQQIQMGVSGLFVAFICLFYPSKSHSRNFVTLIILFYLLLLFLFTDADAPQLQIGVSMLLVAYLYLFYPSEHHSRSFVALIILFYLLLLLVVTPDTQLGQSDWFDRRPQSPEIFFHHPRSLNWLARSFRTHLERKSQYYNKDQDITSDFKRYIFDGETFYRRCESTRGIFSRGAVSLIVQEGQWYLRVNIPILLPHHTIINMPPDRRERLISLFQNEVVRRSQLEGGWTIFYDKGADTFDILIEVNP